MATKINDNNELNETLKKYQQEHLLKFWEKNTEDENKQLIDDLKNVNFKTLCDQKYFSNDLSLKSSIDDDCVEPLDEKFQQDISKTSTEEIEKFRKIGLNEISNGTVAVLLLAGGQGTRLGSSLPKGMYDLKLSSGKTLFQLQAERIIKLQKMAGGTQSATIPWYIMTSKHTIESTLDYFRKNSYFNLNEKNVIFFTQNNIPCFTMDGKIIMENRYKLSRSPNGNGGLYEALDKNNILQDMNKRGIKHLHVYCVDNILVKVADPVFIGYCISKNIECGAKVVEKKNPNEAVGIICKVENRIKVVEYSEISKTIAEKRNDNNGGGLLFNAGNICNHYFTLKFLQEKVDYNKLPYHVAKKKIPYINDDGTELIKPDKPNGIKLEKFIFDVFQFADVDKFAVWQVLREDEFSPLKNNEQSSNDTPTTVRLSLYNLHQRLILKAGGKIVDKNGESVKCCLSPVLTSDKSEYENQATCEISPLLSYEGEDLYNIVNGKTFTVPVLLN